MQTEAKSKIEDVTFTVRATVRNAMRDDMLRDALGVDLAKKKLTPEQTTQANYCFVAAHVVAIQGVDWQPPDVPADAEAIRANYEQYLDTVPRRLETAISKAINRLYSPTANAVEKPDSALTEDEEADPK